MSVADFGWRVSRVKVWYHLVYETGGFNFRYGGFQTSGQIPALSTPLASTQGNKTSLWHPAWKFQPQNFREKKISDSVWQENERFLAGSFVKEKSSWFQTFALFWMLYSFFPVIPRRLNWDAGESLERKNTTTKILTHT